MYTLRRWTARHARFFEAVYDRFERLLMSLHPLFERIGYQRLEKPAASIEKLVKGVLFDSQMCGSCTLSATGMVCPMNCPKRMRNGPCGGVRTDGCCEVMPTMPCVWIDAYAGSQRMRRGRRILDIQAPLDHRLAERSSWLREVRRKMAGETAGDAAP